MTNVLLENSLNVLAEEIHQIAVDHGGRKSVMTIAPTNTAAKNSEPMNRTIIAIDPGKSGGIAYLLAQNQKPVAMPMPETEGDILDAIQSVTEGNPSPAEVVAYVEQVGGFIKGNPAPGSAMFNFGRNFGFILGCLQALKVRVVLVRPQEWTKMVGVGTSTGLKKTKWKNKLKQRAQQLYPEQKVTLSTADALLILEYATRP